MAKYTFECTACGEVKERIASPRVISGLCASCGGETKRRLPIMNGPATMYEDPDGQSGKKWLDDQAGMIATRKQKHYYEVEVPRLVNSGVYSLETMVENGWIYFDDSGNMRIHTTPPTLR